MAHVDLMRILRVATELGRSDNITCRYMFEMGYYPTASLPSYDLTPHGVQQRQQLLVFDSSSSWTRA
jgi:hypothetical protein